MKKWLALVFFITSLSAQAAEPRSYVIYDLTDDRMVAGKAEHTVMPIASITKLMALTVILDAQQPMYEELVVPVGHVTGHKRVSPGMTLSRRDLINLSLINSDNRAIKTLAYHYPGGETALVRAMNQKKQVLGMHSSEFVEPTGLSKQNVSTAQDLIKLLRAAGSYSMLTENSRTRSYSALVKVKHKISVITANNTNPSITDDVVISKTGFTGPAGFCLAWVWHRGDRYYAGVVLNHPSKYSRKQQVDRILAQL